MIFYSFEPEETSVGGVMVSIDAFQALDPGSIPGHRMSFLKFFLSCHTCKNYIKVLRDGESNPGLPRDRRGYSPLYYRGVVHPFSCHFIINTIVLTLLFYLYKSWRFVCQPINWTFLEFLDFYFQCTSLYTGYVLIDRVPSTTSRKK